MANIESTWLGSWSRCRDVRDNHMRAVAAVKLAAALSPPLVEQESPIIVHQTHLETSDTSLCYF
jgi:hypothetical protein